MYFEVYELDPAHFVSAPGLAWKVALEKTKVKLDLLTDIDMLIMVEKYIRGGICHVTHQYAKANNKYMKDYDENRESSYLKYWNISNLYGWEILPKLPVDGFKCVENTSQLNKGFIENYNEDSDEGYFLEVDVQHPEKLHDLHNDLPFLPERMKFEKVGKLLSIQRA